nr:MAG TPA: hypothetical protein [Caudoviricetes sp.]
MFKNNGIVFLSQFLNTFVFTFIITFVIIHPSQQTTARSNRNDPSRSPSQD